MQVTGELKSVSAKAKAPDEGTAVISGKLECPYSPELFDEAAGLNGVAVQITFAHVSEPDKKYHKFIAIAGVTKVTSAKDVPVAGSGDAESAADGGQVEREDTLDFAFSAEYTPDLFAKLLRWQGPNCNLMFGVMPTQEDAFPSTPRKEPKEVVEKEPRPRARQERMPGTEATEKKKGGRRK